MKILGLDPGLAYTGYAIIKKEKNNIEVIKYGCLNTQAGEKIENRLNNIFKKLNKIINQYNPDKMAAENLYLCKNVSSAFKVGQTKGIINLAAAKKKIPIFEYTPLQIKQAITGYGRASKSQVQKMLKSILKLKKIPTPDHASDALAVAYCCASTKEYLK